MKKGLLILCAIFTCVQLQAQGWGQIQKIVPDDRFVGQQFGATLDIDGNYAVVGVLVSNTASEAYVYENDGTGNWVQLQKLESPQYHQFHHFGTAVAISDDYIFVGSWGQDYDENGSNFMDSAGAVFIFKKQASGLFEFEQKIVASDREALNAFGYAVAVDGNYAVVSPVRHDFDASGNNFLDDAGAAYIFERDGNGVWNEVQKIVASDRAVQDYFGQSALAVNGDYIAVGSFADDDDENGENPLSSTGSAYIFERDTNGIWNETQKIAASDRAQGDWFGWSISLSGNHLVVGSNQDDSFTGSAYVFQQDGTGTWNEIQKLTASDATSGDRFGQSVAMDGNHIIVGAYLKNFTVEGTSYSGGGRAYIYEKDVNDTWNEVQNIYALDREQSDYFGYDVAISGDYAMVGAYWEDEDETGENNLSQAGSAYIFDANEPSTLSVVKTDLTTEVKAYPNPTNGNFKLALGKTYNKVKVVMRTLLGQELMNESYNSVDEIHLQIQQAQGLYLIEVVIDNKTVAQLKLVKQ